MTQGNYQTIFEIGFRSFPWEKVAQPLIFVALGLVLVRFLKPKKSRGNQRLYVKREVEMVLEIKRMLYEEGHTLAGVKRYWARRGRVASQRVRPKELAQKLRGNLQAILKIMESYSN